MKKEMIRRWFLHLLVLIVLGFAVLNIMAYNHAYAMMHFASGGHRTDEPEHLSIFAKLRVLLVGVNVPRPVSDQLPQDLSPDCQSLSISGHDKVTLSAWYADRGVETPLVILFHGYSAEKSCLIGEAKSFLDMGASVLLVDFRGSGGSSESYTTIGLREGDDVAAVMRYARERLSHHSVILFGQSMGAVAILRAVHEYDIMPDAVILEAVFDTLLNTVRNRFDTMNIPSFPSAELLVFWGGKQWGFSGFAHNPIEYARSLKCPALFMHGTDDPRATVAEGHRVFAAASGLKEFKEFEHTGHESYVSTHPSEWRSTVGGFIKTYHNP